MEQTSMARSKGDCAHVTDDETGIVPGTIVESHRDASAEEDKLLNVCYFIDHQGNVAGKYVKKNLWYVSHVHTRY
jgi:predicted amidohydrolase